MSAFIKSGQPNTMGRLLSTIAYPVQYPNVCTLQSAVIPWSQQEQCWPSFAVGSVGPTPVLGGCRPPPVGLTDLLTVGGWLSFPKKDLWPPPSGDLKCQCGRVAMIPVDCQDGNNMASLWQWQQVPEDRCLIRVPYLANACFFHFVQHQTPYFKSKYVVVSAFHPCLRWPPQKTTKQVVSTFPHPPSSQTVCVPHSPSCGTLFLISPALLESCIQGCMVWYIINQSSCHICPSFKK